MHTRITPKKVEFDEDGYQYLVNQIEKLENSYNALVNITQNLVSNFTLDDGVLEKLKFYNCDIAIIKDSSSDKNPRMSAKPKYMGKS
jgi:hypothetical protein